MNMNQIINSGRALLKQFAVVGEMESSVRHYMTVALNLRMSKSQAMDKFDG